MKQKHVNNCEYRNIHASMLARTKRSKKEAADAGRGSDDENEEKLTCQSLAQLNK